jgi:hypothetical protein
MHNATHGINHPPKYQEYSIYGSIFIWCKKASDWEAFTNNGVTITGND